MATLSKSSFLKGRQCPRRLWLARKQPPEPPSASEDEWEMREREGARVEQLVETLFPDSKRIAETPGDDEVDELSVNERRLQATTDALGAGYHVFQAYLQSGGLLAVVDFLEPRDDNKWFLWEIKAATHTVALHDWDLAYQVEVARRTGLDIAGAGVWHLDKEYVRGPELDTRLLLKTSDRTEEVFQLLENVRSEILAQQSVLAAGEVPDVVPGKRCKGYREAKDGKRPSDCGQLTRNGYCGERLPPNWAGRLIGLRGKKVKFVEEMLDPRVELLDPDDADRKWTDAQERMIRAVKQNEPVVDRDALQAWIGKLKFPIAYFDCEFDPGMAIPLYEGMSPYDRLPFQWSLCVEEAPGTQLQKPEPFLYTQDGDPRRPFIDSLFAALPDQGSVVVFYETAEKTVLKQLGEAFGDPLQSRVADLVENRFVDMYDLVRAGYYHPDQEGSYSIKRVSPPLTGKGYEDLDVQNGMAAVVTWHKALAASPGERDEFRHQLLAYCERDAELMFHMMEALRSFVQDEI